MGKLKILAVFFGVFWFIWTVTEPKTPKIEPPPQIVRRKLPKETPYKFPENYAGIHKELEGVSNEVSSSFAGSNVPVLILPVFTMSTGGTPVLLNFVTESAYAHLSKSKNIRIVKRDYNKSKSRLKAKYILIGRLSSVGNQIRVSLRIENINTGEIVDVFDDYIDKTKASQFL
jgi:TolB-like protein